MLKEKVALRQGNTATTATIVPSSAQTPAISKAVEQMQQDYHKYEW